MIPDTHAGQCICITQGVSSDQSAGWHRNLHHTACQVVFAGRWAQLIRITWCCTCISAVLSLSHTPQQVGGGAFVIDCPHLSGWWGGNCPSAPTPVPPPMSYLQNLKSLSPLTTQIWKAIQNVEIGWFGVSRSLEIAPINRTHTSSY